MWPRFLKEADASAGRIKEEAEAGARGQMLQFATSEAGRKRAQKKR